MRAICAISAMLVLTACGQTSADVADAGVNEGWLYCNDTQDEDRGRKLYINKKTRLVVMFSADTSFDRALLPHPQRADGLGVVTEFGEDGVQMVSRGQFGEQTIMAVDYKTRTLVLNNSRIACKRAPGDTLVANDASAFSGPVFSVVGGLKTKAARTWDDVGLAGMESGQISPSGPRFDLNGKLYIKPMSEMEKAAENANRKAGY